MTFCFQIQQRLQVDQPVSEDGIDYLLFYIISTLLQLIKEDIINFYQIQNIMQCPVHKSKLVSIPMEQQVQKGCSICGRQATLRCNTCKYVLCSECRICNLEHPLIKIIQLNKVKSQYYSNSYSCNICSKSKTVSDNGIWHCNQCNYDVCEQCAD